MRETFSGCSDEKLEQKIAQLATGRIIREHKLLRQTKKDRARNKEKTAKRQLFEDNCSSDSSETVDDSDADPDYLTENTPDDKEMEEICPGTPEPQVKCRSPHPTPEKPPPTRKRKKGSSKKERNRERRNADRQYQNKQRMRFFYGFWNLSTFDKQNGYLFGLIEAYTVKRRYGQGNSDQSHCQKSYYFMLNIDGKLVHICRKSFIAVHGLQNNRGRINNILKQIKTCSTPKTDQRGKHSNRWNHISDEKIEAVHDHIKTISTYQSHYSRTQNPKCVYFDCNLNISSLYSDFFIQYCEENGIEPVSEDKYRRIFFENYIIGFKLPKSDTCKTCDQLHEVIQSESSTEKEKREASKEKDSHLRRTDAVREKLKEMSALAKEHPEEVHVISIDLQQTLLTPKLSCGPAFYLRKLWTYNVGIHECGQNVGYMFVWDETVGARESDEIGSCLFKYITSRNIHCQKLVVFSDNCGGQNKNYNIVALYNYLISQCHLTEIEHYYLISGHTFLPSDRDFAKIEKYHTRHECNVYTPDQWIDIITKSSLKRNIISQKKNCNDGKEVLFKDAICIWFEKNSPMKMKIKDRLFAEFSVVSLSKRGNPTTKWELMKKYNGSNLINLKKVADIKRLLPYVPSIHHDYYNNLQEKPEESDENMPEILD
ncbi:hypothetical protein ANN_17479 [Periplaneta americana]|uniref:DUF7869 domain-containing protein n=1 Tax=Periplaneta americana TaxID=6978 RepID=A0ABQ8SV67_PERAM|nr:hypothetical protein ANN_17479 [Periplaneta americana]